MSASFADWLNARLAEREWIPADLTRASKTPDNPRGLDSGLISRWRLRPPLGSVPTQAQTLQRLAAALNVPEREVYAAAGLAPADVPSSTVQTELEVRLSRLGATLSRYPRSVWLAILEANERMAEAWASEPPVNAPDPHVLNAPKSALTGGNSPRKRRLPRGQHGVEVLAAYA